MYKKKKYKLKMKYLVPNKLKKQFLMPVKNILGKLARIKLRVPHSMKIK
jgi:hypothetical protein